MVDVRARLCAALLGLTSIPGLVLASSAVLQGCGPSDTVTGALDGGAIDGAIDGGAIDTSLAQVEMLMPNAPPLPGETECKVVKTTKLPSAGALHVTACIPIAYATNPPSSGTHWPIWPAWKAYTKPVPRESYVHGMEHGAVILSYRCDPDCPDVVKMLEEVRAEVTPDPKCLSVPGGPAARIVLTPDPLLDKPIAASAWGATYTATCIDKASLAQFVAETYAHTAEDICNNGVDWDNPGAGVPDCGDN